MLQDSEDTLIMAYHKIPFNWRNALLFVESCSNVKDIANLIDAEDSRDSTIYGKRRHCLRLWNLSPMMHRDQISHVD